MDLSSRRFADVVVLSVKGRLDQDTCEAFRVDLTAKIDEAARGGGAVVLDLGGLDYVSSAGLRCFMLASRHAKAVAGRLSAAAPQPLVAEIFAISHFNLVFQVFPTVAAALAAMSEPAATAFEQG